MIVLVDDPELAEALRAIDGFRTRIRRTERYADLREAFELALLEETFGQGTDRLADVLPAICDRVFLGDPEAVRLLLPMILEDRVEAGSAARGREGAPAVGPVAGLRSREASESVQAADHHPSIERSPLWLT